MNITGVDFIAVPTQDFEKADEFYGGVLGLERSKPVSYTHLTLPTIYSV